MTTPPADRREDLLTALLDESALGRQELATTSFIEFDIPCRRDVWHRWTDDVDTSGDPCAELGEVLNSHGISAHVHALPAAVPEQPGRLRISLAPDGDVPELVARIRDQLTTEAVQGLNEALIAHDITDDRPYENAYSGYVTGDFGFTDAIQLYNLLPAGPERTVYEESDMTWETVEHLANDLGPLLREASGDAVSVDSSQPCGECGRIRLVLTTPAQVRRLTAAIHAAGAS